MHDLKCTNLIQSVALPAMGHRGTYPHSTSNNFIFSSLWSKSDSQLSKYVVCKIAWCRCHQLTALSINTALVTKLLVIEQLLHPALKSTVSAPWHNLQLCPLTTNPDDATEFSDIFVNGEKIEVKQVSLDAAPWKCIYLILK